MLGLTSCDKDKLAHLFILHIKSALSLGQKPPNRKEKMIQPKFKHGDKVTLVIDSSFIAQVALLVVSERDIIYKVSYYRDSEPRTAEFYDFELVLISEAKRMGFGG